MIELIKVSKNYTTNTSAWNASLDYLTFGLAKRGQCFTALHDITLTVGEGNSLGIIGPNGAGKTTLLKLIAGVTPPSSGIINVKGPVSALLELGAGFHPEMTGYQNAKAYLNLFHPEENIDELLGIVADFSELGRFFYEPLKTYSTGMQVRLGFAAASVVRPDVLIVDEALSVGDAYFQQKCLDRIQSFKKEGVTLLFVSHAENLVEMFCSDAIYIEKGEIIDHGSAKDVVATYKRDVARKRGLITNEGQQTVKIHSAPHSINVSQETSEEDINKDVSPVNSKSDRPLTIGSSYGNKKIRILCVEACDEDGNQKSIFASQECLFLKITIDANEDYSEAVFACAIFRIDGIYIFSTNNYEVSPSRLSVCKGINTISVAIGPMNLHRGTFFASVGVYTEPQAPFWNDPADYHYKKYEFHVKSSQFPHGCIHLESQWDKLKNQGNSP